ncbi:hypothetical protein EDE12_10350 [Methylosinus sp. sav-2]|nr:hypothetical protein [Methylosinus sp. sav-2]TDX65079.1 hypothetical protein EDE12_10350 [Methylosinus sp. sav-2]
MSTYGANDPIVFTLLAEAVVIAVAAVSIVGYLLFKAGASALSKPHAH